MSKPSKSIKINLTNVPTELEIENCDGQNLYDAYVALTCHIIQKLSSPSLIDEMSRQAVIDAKNILETKPSYTN